MKLRAQSPGLSTAGLPEGSTPHPTPPADQPSTSPSASSSRLPLCLGDHAIPTNALSHSVALIRPCIWLWAFLVGLVSLLRAAFYHYAGRTHHRIHSTGEPRTRPRPSPPNSRRSSIDKVPALTPGGGELDAGVSSGLSTLGRYISTSAQRFHSTLRPPPVLKIGGHYHQLDKVAETDEDVVVQSAPPASPVSGLDHAPWPRNRRAEADEANAPGTLNPSPSRQTSSDHELEGELTEDSGSSDGVSEACTVDDYRAAPQPSPTSARKAFASWLTRPLSRRRGSSDPSARSDTSLSAASTDSARSISSSTSSNKLHCPSQRIADRRQAKKNRSVTAPIPTRPKLHTSASTSAAPAAVPAPAPASSSDPSARSLSPIPSLSLSRPRSTPFLRSGSLDGLTSASGLAQGPVAEWQPPAPKRSNTLGSKLRARSPFSPKIRSPLATPPASPTLNPTVPGLAFLRRKSWDSDLLDKGAHDGARGTSPAGLAKPA